MGFVCFIQIFSADITMQCKEMFNFSFVEKKGKENCQNEDERIFNIARTIQKQYKYRLVIMRSS